MGPIEKYTRQDIPDIKGVFIPFSAPDETEEGLSMGDPFQRKYMRLKVSRPVEFTTGGRIYHGVITDESGGGVFVEIKGKFFQGNRIKMTYVTHQSVPVTRNGKIVRVEPKGIAVAFDDPRYAR